MANKQTNSVQLLLQGDPEVRLFWCLFNHDAVCQALGLTDSQWEEFSQAMETLYGENFVEGAYDGQFDFIHTVFGEAAKKWLQKTRKYKGLTIDSDPKWSRKLDEYRKRQDYLRALKIRQAKRSRRTHSVKKPAETGVSKL